MQCDLIDVTNDLSSRWVEDDRSGRKSSDSEFLLMDVLFSHDERLIGWKSYHQMELAEGCNGFGCEYLSLSRIPRGRVGLIMGPIS